MTRITHDFKKGQRVRLPLDGSPWGLQEAVVTHDYSGQGPIVNVRGVEGQESGVPEGLTVVASGLELVQPEPEGL